MTNAELRTQVEELKIQLEFSRESNQTLRGQLQQANGFVSKQLDILQTETQIRKQHQDVMLSVFNVVLKVADSFFSGQAKEKLDDLKLYKEYIENGGNLTFDEWMNQPIEGIEIDEDDDFNNPENVN